MATKKQFSSFEDLIDQSDKPLLIDFYATWCGPCQMLVPILSQVQQLMKGKIQVVKVDTDRYPKLAQRFQVQALPTLVFLKDGQPVQRLEGVLPAEKIIDLITPYV